MKTTWIVAALFALASSQPATAQDAAGAVGAKPLKKVTYEFEAIVIQGNVEKPQVQYVMSREKLQQATGLEKKESFLDRITKAVKEEPF